MLLKKIINNAKTDLKSYPKIKYFDTPEGNLDSYEKDKLLKEITESYQHKKNIYGGDNKSISPENLILRSIIINMYNYNFWGEKQLFNSSDLLDRIYKILDNKTLSLFFHSDLRKRHKFYKKLLKCISHKSFKNRKKYIKTTKYFFDITIYSRERVDYVRKYISRILNKKIDIDSFIKFLGTVFPSFGNDRYFKREILAWYFIKDVIPNHLLLHSYSEHLYFPIDYRLPSALKFLDFIKLPKKFNKYFDGKTVIKSKRKVNAIRAATFLALINLNKWLKLDEHKLDYYFFNKSRTEFRDNHLRFETTDF